MTSQPTITPDLAEAGRALQEALAPKETDMQEEQPRTDIRPEAQSATKRRYRRKTNIQRVLDVLKDGNARDVEAIAKQAGLSNEQVHGSSWLLCKEGTIARIGHGTYILTKALNDRTPEEPTPIRSITVTDQDLADLPLMTTEQAPSIVPPPQQVADSVSDGLVEFLIHTFNLDPIDVGLAIGYYRRFIAKEGK